MDFFNLQYLPQKWHSISGRCSEEEEKITHESSINNQSWEKFPYGATTFTFDMKIEIFIASNLPQNTEISLFVKNSEKWWRHFFVHFLVIN